MASILSQEEFIKQCNNVFQEIKELTPIDTGNLRYNSLKMYKYKGKVKIFVEQKIAPYMPYTNEPWISPRWGGKKNPNEGWWQRFFDKTLSYSKVYFNAE